MGTKCPKCEKTGFETTSENVQGSKLVLTFIRCIHCKTAISIMEPEFISLMLRDLAKKQGHTFLP